MERSWATKPGAKSGFFVEKLRRDTGNERSVTALKVGRFTYRPHTLLSLTPYFPMISCLVPLSFHLSVKRLSSRSLFAATLEAERAAP
jgi:hypothetical protein